MPGHFTHMYSARRVRDHLNNGQFPDWPEIGGALDGFTAAQCGAVMTKWEKFVHIGAVGPDLFYFSQDWNNDILGPISDEVFLTFAVYFFLDAEKEQGWEVLLAIVEESNAQLAGILRFLIKMQKIWNDFVAGWNATIGPIASDIENLADGLTGGVLSQFGVVLEELLVAFKVVAEEELLTFKDIFSGFDTCVQKGFNEPSFLWSDMSHYRKPSAMCQSLMKQVRIMAQQAATLKAAGKGAEAVAMQDRSDQFLAFALGYMTHLGVDTVCHSFVNEQCGGPYRNHPQRHHLIENHIDAWNYDQTQPGKKLEVAGDPWGSTPDYPGISMSALWFAVQITPDQPHGVQRPTGPWPNDAARTKALDVDGEMPDWMANAMVEAMMDCFPEGSQHPQILQGNAFQNNIDGGLLDKIFRLLTGDGIPEPVGDLVQAIAPTPPFVVRHGFPMPWQIKTTYKIMYTYYRLVYNGTWELEKPKAPDFIIFPPVSDFTDLLQPPDLSGVDSSNPVVDLCELLVALVEWAIKEVEAAIKLVGDLIKMLVSPFTYFIRLGLYDLAMLVWDLITRTHELLAHTGFLTPHAEQLYGNGKVRLPNEIDIPLITLGGTVDSAFRAALAAAFDPLGNLDTNPDVIGVGHSVNDSNYPYYPVLRYQTDGNDKNWEFRRPWAWPDKSPVQQPTGPDTLRTTPTETYNPFKSFGEGPDEAVGGLVPGPYPIGTMPDVFFRLNGQIDTTVRALYEQAQTPHDTDMLNTQFLSQRHLEFSPLGDPIPFSAHLIAQLANDTGYSTQFNLDSDRAFAYLTWDWIRRDASDSNNLGKGALDMKFPLPVVPPVGDPGGSLFDPQANPLWHPDQGKESALQLQYVDKPNKKKAPPPPPPPPIH